MKTVTNGLEATVADVLVDSHVTLTEAAVIAYSMGITSLEGIIHTQLGSISEEQMAVLTESLHRLHKSTDTLVGIA